MYFFTYALLYIVSLLPLPVLYVLAHGLISYPLRWFGYRRNVILTNLARSFPEKHYNEIKAISHAFYLHFGDMVAETIWLLSASEAQRRKRFDFPQYPFMKQMYEKGKSVIVVMGHFGNWEYTQSGGCKGNENFGGFPFENVCIAYQKQRSKVFDRLMYKLRTRNKTGFHVIEHLDFVKYLFAHRRIPHMYCLIADQCPLPGTRYSAQFLNQPTLMVDGPEVLARRFSCAVVYASLEQTRRGYYHVRITPICEDAAQMSDGAITQEFARLLEEDIRKTPAMWLWSHKRWKRTPLTEAQKLHK